MVRAFSLPADR